MSQRSRGQRIAALGAGVAAAGLAYAAYSYFAKAAGDDARPPPVDSRKGKEKASVKRKGTLSFYSEELPPLELLEDLCRHYTVHVLLRSPPNLAADPYDRPDVPPQLSGVAGLDERRILFFSKPEGRIHVVRALACDVHVEVSEAAAAAATADEAGGGGEAPAAAGEGSWVLPDRDEPALPLARVVAEVKTFVGTLVVVSTAEEAADIAKGGNVRTTRSVNEAVALLCAG